MQRPPATAGRRWPGRGGPWRQQGDGGEQNGRGLLIVGELASRWGREETGAGRTVWFEIDW